MTGPAIRSLVSRVLLASLASLTLFAITANAHADTSGETGMGYDWTDNQSPRPTTTFQWVDIAQSGSRVERLSTCDDCLEGNVPIGFEFSFYGDAYSTVGINSNGTLQFVDTEDFWGPGRLPTHDFVGPVLLPLWGDWDPRSSGNIYVETLANWPGSGGLRAFVVQWDDVENWDCRRGNNATWQAVLLEDGSFIFQYLDTVLGDLDCNSGADMTIGIQQGVDGCFVMYSHRFASVPDGTAIAWSPQSSTCAQPEATATAVPAPTADGPSLPERGDTGSQGQAPLPNDGNQGLAGLPNDGSGPLSDRSAGQRSSAVGRYLLLAGAVLLLAGAGWAVLPFLRPRT